MIKIVYLRIVGEISKKYGVEKFNKVYLFVFTMGNSEPLIC